jgi:cytochrome c biogenesis protein CcdA
MKPNLIITLTLLFVLISGTVEAQEVGDFLRDNNKVNAVIVILLIILIGLFSFLFYIERKVKKLEE